METLFAQSTDVAKTVVSGATRTELLAALSALGGVVVFLWRLVMNKNAETEKMLTTKWEECEKGHTATTNRLIQLSSEVGEMRGKIEVLSSQVLHQVHPEQPPMPNDSPPNS